MTLRQSSGAVVCVGRLYCDLIFTDIPRLPTLGTEVFAGGLGLHAGGGAFITGAHLAALGRSVSLAAMIPGEPFGGIVRRDLKNTGLDIALCETADAALDPQITVAMAGQGDRAFLTRRTGPVAPEITVNDLKHAGARHMHIGELASLIERPELLSVAKALNLTVSLDCGWDDGLEVSKAADLISAVDVFLPNECEAHELATRGVSPDLAPLTIIKRGANGASALTDGEMIDAPAERVEAVDTTGAGDAFNAGFLNAWLDSEKLSNCLKSGNNLGAMAVGRRGGFSVDRAPAPVEVDTVL